MKRKRFRMTPAAKADLIDIFEEIRYDRPMAAERVLAELRAAMRRLAQSPGMGHVREELTDNETLKFWPVYSFLIVYRFTTRPIEIIRVLHGKRDVRRILERVI